MTIRRVLWVAIPLLLVAVLVGGGALAWVLLRDLGSASPVQLVVVGADKEVRLLDDDGGERLIAADARTGDYSFPATSPDGGRVAYVRTTDAGSAIVVFDIASGERTELYRSRENVPIDLAWSPDGRHIVFLIGSNLTAQIVPADGSRPARLVAAGSPSFFAWSPDGAKLLVHVGGHAVDGGKVALYHPDQDQATPLFGDPGLFQAPAWSIDGRALFYVAQPPYESARLTLSDLKSDIMRASAEGKSLLEGHPGRGAVPLVEGIVPQHQDVDAAVGHSVVSAWQPDPPGGVAGTPGLQPGPDALLEVGDHALGDVAVEVSAAGCGGGSHRLAPFACGHFAKEASRSRRSFTRRGNANTGALRSRHWFWRSRANGAGRR